MRNSISHNYPSHSCLNRQRGVGLIEILIAVVLISAGFLAAARMQVEGMRFSQSAYFQSQAYFMASDMIDRMRNNARGVADGHYSDQKTSAKANNPGCNLSACQASAIAEQDMFDWSANLYSADSDKHFVAALPGTESNPASGEIVEVSDGIYAVIMRWNEVVGGANSEQSFRVQFAIEEDQ